MPSSHAALSLSPQLLLTPSCHVLTFASAEAASFTQGVHIGSRLYPCSQLATAQKVPLLAFVDMEGQGDCGIRYDVKLATPLLLVAKVVVLNVVCPNGPSRIEILDTLAIMMRAARQVQSASGDVFGNLHLVLRDCMNDEAECHRIVFDLEDEHLGAADITAVRERNQIRNRVGSSVPGFFEVIKLCTRQRNVLKLDSSLLNNRCSHPKQCFFEILIRMG